MRAVVTIIVEFLKFKTSIVGHTLFDRFAHRKFFKLNTQHSVVVKAASTVAQDFYGEPHCTSKSHRNYCI